jgi:hypothetical protein
VFNWGIYEADKLTTLPSDAFRSFVIAAYGGTLSCGGGPIHGRKGRTPLFVGSPRQDEPVQVGSVATFAKALMKSGDRDELQGTLLAWTFTREAQEAADRLLAQRRTALRFVQLKLVNLESAEFKAHIVSRSPQYEPYLTFVLPPAVRFSVERIGPREVRFDASESQCLNAGGSLINVQWDFDYGDLFTSTAGYTLTRKGGRLSLDATYRFPSSGQWTVACRIQDDAGGQATAVTTVTAS